MTWYMTEYRVAADAKYGDIIWARGWKDAERIVKLRRMGEKVIGSLGRKPRPRTDSPSYLLRRRKLDTARVQHALAWISLLALKSRVATPLDLFGDRGLVHLFAHYCQWGHARPEDGYDREERRLHRPRRLADVAAEIERRIPGYDCRR